MRILLVDGQNKTAAYLRKGLAENGFAVDVARQGQLHLTQKADYDLMVVNTIPEWPVFSELRRSGKHTPVLFLAAGGRVDGPVRRFRISSFESIPPWAAPNSRIWRGCRSPIWKST